MSYTKKQMAELFKSLEKLSDKYKHLIDEEENYADELLIFKKDYERLKKKVLEQ